MPITPLCLWNPSGGKGREKVLMGSNWVPHQGNAGQVTGFRSVVYSNAPVLQEETRGGGDITQHSDPTCHRQHTA